MSKSAWVMKRYVFINQYECESCSSIDACVTECACTILRVEVDEKKKMSCLIKEAWGTSQSPMTGMVWSLIEHTPWEDCKEKGHWVLPVVSSGCRRSVNPKPRSRHCGWALKSLHQQSSCFHEWGRGSTVTRVTGECSVVVLVPASQPAAAVCACKEAESSAAWSQPPCLWTCWDQNLTPADGQNSRWSRWGKIIAGRCWTCGTVVDPSIQTETTGQAYLVRVVKRFSVTFDWCHIFIPKHKRGGSNKSSREM